VAAAKGTVILKNNGALPLTGKEKLTTVFGSDAGPNTWGPNGCSDRGCDNGTLAMGWGSGTANFPYLITPDTAIQNEVIVNGTGFYESILVDNVYSNVQALARRADQVDGVCIAFVNSDSGEGYIVVDNNEGDRNNLTLWHNGDALIANVTSQCSNTVVVIHSVGAVNIETFYDNPNVTAIVWAGIPGQESGNSLVDILYGRQSPGRTPFTWGTWRGSWGTDLLYTPNMGNNTPQLDFAEGIFIDYRGFDALGETPIYEFGYGLSWTTFEYSNLQITPQPSNFSYSPASGLTPVAPLYGTISNDSSQYLCAPGMTFLEGYIYPCINTTNLTAASNDPEYGNPVNYPSGAYDNGPQPRVPAGGAPGGNPALYDVLYTVTATITNTGTVESDEVPQLYLSLGGPNDAKVVLRGFDRLTIAPGASATFTVDLTRRDISNWEPISQNW
jgi:beta-glucosidase